MALWWAGGGGQRHQRRTSEPLYPRLLSLPLQGRNVSCGSAAVPSPSPTSSWEPPCTASSSWDCPRSTGKTAAGPTCSLSSRGSRSAWPSGKSLATSTPPCCRPSSPTRSGWSSGNPHLSLGRPSSWAPWVGWATLPTGTSRKNTSRARPGLGACRCVCTV